MTPAKLIARQRLAAAFAAAFDRSRAEALLAGSRPQVSGGARAVDLEASGLRLIGEGACFESWLWPTRAPGRGIVDGGIRPLCDLVLKRARPEWLAQDQCRRSLGSWLKSLQVVQERRASIPLIPPFAMLQVGAHIGMVMPHGQLDMSAVAPYWQPLDQEVSQALHQLGALGLTLGDVPQLAVWGSQANGDGQPFIFDFSDLAAKRG